jgi:O-acetyl-ADP-ribose deacetylase (regulator of RNase III)
VVTTGGNLPARHVIHTVGPVYRGGDRGEAELLGNAYRNSLRVASENGCKSVAFPSISTGAYGYPIGEAARIAHRTVAEYLQTDTGISLVRFVLFSAPDYQEYEKALESLSKE